MKRKRIPRRVYIPTLVAMYVAPEYELSEHLALQAFIDGRAGERQFNVMADMRDLLALAAADRNDEGVLALCEAGEIALNNIKDRYLAKDRLGTTGEELAALRALVDVSEDWWKRQGGTLFHDTNIALDKARKFERERKAA